MFVSLSLSSLYQIMITLIYLKTNCGGGVVLGLLHKRGGAVSSQGGGEEQVHGTGLMRRDYFYVSTVRRNGERRLEWLRPGGGRRVSS